MRVTISALLNKSSLRTGIIQWLQNPGSESTHISQRTKGTDGKLWGGRRDDDNERETFPMSSPKMLRLLVVCCPYTYIHANNRGVDGKAILYGWAEVVVREEG